MFNILRKEVYSFNENLAILFFGSWPVKTWWTRSFQKIWDLWRHFSTVGSADRRLRPNVSKFWLKNCWKKESFQIQMQKLSVSINGVLKSYILVILHNLTTQALKLLQNGLQNPWFLISNSEGIQSSKYKFQKNQNFDNLFC